MPAFHFQELFELGDDDTEYRSLGSQHVRAQRLGGRDVLVVQPEALRTLAAAAIRDISHLFRTGHLSSCARSSKTQRHRRTTASSRSRC